MYAKGIPLDVVLNDIPDKKLAQLKKKGVETLRDLLMFAPRRYELRDTAVSDFDQLGQYCGQTISVQGVIVDINVNYGKDILQVRIHDVNHKPMTITWFHQNYLSSRFTRGKKLAAYGIISFNPNFGYGMASPMSFCDPGTEDAYSPLPIYGKVRGMSEEYLTDCIAKAIRFSKAAGTSDPIPEDIRTELQLNDWDAYIDKMHNPRNKYDIEAVQKRQCAEELLPFAIEMTRRKMEFNKTTDKKVPVQAAEKALADFIAMLPFSLTKDQTSTLLAIRDTMCSGQRVDALVQGDVGCGKTMIAAGATAIAIAGGYQVAVMAPTTVLADQHYAEFKERFEPMGYNVVFLGGDEKAKEKRETLAKIKKGVANIIVGTHAIFADTVEFASLGLTVVDEEHRFGVEQREKLRTKSQEGAHAISMSATPIPRTLALALYGDFVTVYNIHTLPKGRKPIITQAFSNELKTYEAMYRQIRQGHQCYLVCPLITANDSDIMADVESLEETEEKIRAYFKNRPEVRIASINGKMKANTIKETIDDFAKHKYDILLSTTIVEVGVNVPNATVMIIKNAERFGLAQLHQLRGRVGRGKDQSYCVLLSPHKDRPRLQIMTKTTDGFVIAQEDLALRGTGNLVGTEQSGIDAAVTAMVMYPDFYKQIMQCIEKQMRTKYGQEKVAKISELIKAE